jgi:5-methylcytosine-specific restriction enzyme subunit McrC
MTASQRALRLTEWQTLGPDACPDLLGFLLPQDAATQTLAQRLTAAGMLRITELRQGLHLQASSFVGRLRLGSLDITIHPKIAVTQLLRLLRYAYGLRDLRLLSSVTFGAAPAAFQDLLIAQLAAEAQEIMARGVHRQYLRVDSMLTSPRGRIDLQEIARRVGSPSTSLPCVHYDRLPDNIFNRVLLAGLGLARGLTTNIALRAELYRCAAVLQDGVSPIRLDRAALRTARRAASRLTVAYAPALTLIELLLRPAGISLDSNQQDLELSGFLFDMNRFFQALLSRFFTECLPDLRVLDQYQLRGMFRYDRLHNPQHRQAPTPRPDYVIFRGDDVVAVLDAKYRDLWAEPLPSSMLYQLALYALGAESAGTAAILYPTLDATTQEARIDVCHPTNGVRQAQVVLRPVHLARLDDALFARYPSAAEKARMLASIAERLAFGQGLS